MARKELVHHFQRLVVEEGETLFYRADCGEWWRREAVELLSERQSAIHRFGCTLHVRAACECSRVVCGSVCIAGFPSARRVG